MKVPLATLRRPLLEGSCCVQADRLVSSECVHVDLVLKSASLSLESSKGLAVIPSPREVDGQKEAPHSRAGEPCKQQVLPIPSTHANLQELELQTLLRGIM